MPAGYIDEPTKAKLLELTAKAKAAVEERDQAIFEAVEAGISLRTIGDVLGLAHSTVRYIAKSRRDVLEGRKPRKGNYPADLSE